MYVCSTYRRCKALSNNLFCLLTVFLAIRPECVGAQAKPIVARPEMVLQVGHNQSIFTVAISPNGKWIATGSEDYTIKLWDIASATLLRTFTGHRQSVSAVVFSPDGRTLASSSDDHTVRLWDILSGRLKRILQGHSDGAGHLAFSPDGAMLAGASGTKFRECKVQVWDTRTWQLRREWTDLEGDICALNISPNSRLVACCDGAGSLHIWDTHSGHRKLSLGVHGYGGTEEMAFSPDSNRIVLAMHERHG